jgi:AcrR family transcriptional regulator
MARSGTVAKHRKPKGAYHHGDLRDALLAEALKLIEQRGASELSLRELARRLGVSSAAPYHHFANRTELLWALAMRGFERLEASMRAELESAGDVPTERLRAIGRGYLRFALAHPSQFRLMFQAGHGRVPPPEHREDGRAFGLLREVVICCLEHAGRAGEDPMPSVVAMWGGVHGIAALRLDGPLTHLGTPSEVSELCEQALGVLSRALAVR